MSDWHDAAWRPAANPWLVSSAATLAPFMEILDTTIVNVSLPYIAGSLSAEVATESGIRRGLVYDHRMVQEPPVNPIIHP